MAKTQQQGARLEVFSLPEEEKSFEISNFYLKADKYAGKFEWIDKYLDNYNGHKIGVKGINMLMQAINGEIMNRGYVTTRVYVEEQDLSTGNFFFTLLPKMNTMNACMKSTKNLPVFSAANLLMYMITAILTPLSVPIFPAAA